jgi:hypothetical protein
VISCIKEPPGEIHPMVRPVHEARVSTPRYRIGRREAAAALGIHEEQALGERRPVVDAAGGLRQQSKNQNPCRGAHTLLEFEEINPSHHPTLCTRPPCKTLTGAPSPRFAARRPIVLGV